MANHTTPLLHDYLEGSAARLPDKIALVCQGRRHTYAEIDQSANALAHLLWEQGLGRGDRVLLFLENSFEFVVGYFAALKAGGVPTPISPQTKEDKLRYLLLDSSAQALIADEALSPVFLPASKQAPQLGQIVTTGASFTNRADRPPPRRCIDIDLAAIIYTSGSTGEPKGVMLTHRNMLTAATSITSLIGNTQDDVIINVLPMSMNYGLYQMIMAFCMGARLVLERSFAFPAKVLSVMAEERVTGLPGVPTIYALLSEMRSLANYDLSTLTYITNTAAALPQKHIDFLRQAFPSAKIFSMYGLTECKRCTYLPPCDLDRKPGSVGIAIPNTEVWLVDEKGTRLPRGATGELVVRGATVMRGYWEKEEATRKVLRPGPLPGEHVLYTGDLCRMDEDGYVYFVSRMDDVLKCRGEKVAPAEVERAILGLPHVKEVAVIGVPDELLGQAVKAFVIPESSPGGAALTQREIQRGCQALLEPYMVPKYISIVFDLPRTSTGKIQKSALS